MKSVFKHFSKKTLSMIIAFAVVICSFGSTLSTFMDFGAKAVGVEHFKVTYGSPAVPMFEKTTINLYDLKVQFAKGGSFVYGTEITWSAEAGTPAAEYLNATNKTFTALGTGIFKVIATETANTANTKLIYIIVNEKDDYDFKLVNLDFQGNPNAYVASDWIHAISKNTSDNTSASNDRQAASTTGFYKFTNNNFGYTGGALKIPENYSREGVLFYNAPILSDFEDYKVSVDAKYISNGGDANDYIAIYVRANVNFATPEGLASNSTTPSGLEAKSNIFRWFDGSGNVTKVGTAMYFAHHLNGAVLMGSLNDANINTNNAENAARAFGRVSNGRECLPLHSLSGSDWKKTLGYNSLGVPSTDADYTLNPYVKTSGGVENKTRVRNVTIELNGKDVVYSIDNNVILDTTKQMYQVSASNGNAAEDGEVTLSDGSTKHTGDITQEAYSRDTYLTKFDTAGVATAGNAIGFGSFQRSADISKITVSINGVDGAEDMPIAEEVALETINDKGFVSGAVNANLDLSGYIYAFAGGAHIGNAIDFSLSDDNASVNKTYVTISGKNFVATKAGVYAVEATYNSETITFFVKVTATTGVDFYTVKDASPAIPMFVDKSIDLGDMVIQFSNGNYYYGADIIWAIDASNEDTGYVFSASDKFFGVVEKGMYILEATVETDNGTLTRKVYVIANAKDDYNFYLVNQDWNKDFSTFNADDWMFAAGSTEPNTTNWKNTQKPAQGWSFQYPSSSRDYLLFYYSDNVGIMFYKSEILKVFSDYTFSSTLLNNDDDSSGTSRGFVLRSDINYNASIGSGVFNTSALYLGQHRYGAVYAGAFGKPLMSGNLTSHGMPRATFHSLTGEGYKKFVNVTDIDGSSTSNIAAVTNGAYPGDPNYVLSMMNTGYANAKTVTIKLSGSDILYKIGENTLLDTTKQVYELNNYNKASTASNSTFNWQSAFAANGTVGKGTIGFHVKHGMSHIYGFSVKLNDTTADTMPAMADYNPEKLTGTVTTVVNSTLDLGKYMYGFSAGMQIGSNATFAFSDKNAVASEPNATITDDKFVATKSGVYTLTATYGGEALTFQVFVKPAADKELYKVTDASPAIPMYVKTKIDIDQFAVQFENGLYYYGREIVWSLDASNKNDAGVVMSDVSKTLAAIEKGTYVLKATVVTEEGTFTRRVYFVANDEGDNNFYLVDLDLTVQSEGSGFNPSDWIFATGSTANNLTVVEYNASKHYINGVSSGYTSGHGALIYKNEMLNDFSDYTAIYKFTGSSSTLGEKISFITRAVVPSSVAVGGTIFTRTGEGTSGFNALGLQYPSYGAPALINFTKYLNAAGVFEQDGYYTTDFDNVKYSDPKTNYVITTGATVSVKLMGSNIVSAVNGNVVLDTTKDTINKLTMPIKYANCENSWASSGGIIVQNGTVSGEDFRNLIVNNANMGKGTVGITFIRSDAASRKLTSLKVQLNDITDDKIPVSTEYNPYIVKSASPALPLTAGTKINLSDFMIQLGAFAYEADGLTFGPVAAVQNGAVSGGVKVEGGAIKAYERGVYSVTVTANDGSGRSAKLYVVVKNADEDEYVIYDKDYRSNGVSVSDWTTTVTDDAGNIIANGKYFTEHEKIAETNYDATYVPSYDYMLTTKTENGVKYYIYYKATKTVALNFSGNYADKVGINGFVPYDTTVFQNNFSHTTGSGYSPVNVYTILNNAVVNALADYTVTASFKASPDARGAIGVLGRVNGTAGYGFGAGANGAYNIVGAVPLTAPFTIIGNSLSAFTDNAGVSNYFYNTVSHNNYIYRVYSVKYSGATMSLSTPDGSTKTLSGISNAAGKVGFVTYNKDTFSGYNATPVLAEFKVSIKDVDLSNLPTSSISGYTADTTTKAPVYTADNNVKFTLNTDKAISGFALINNSKPYPEKMIIPNVVDGVKTSVINYDAFNASKNDANKALANTLGEVVISNGIVTIYNGAFRSQKNLDTVTLPKTLETIGESAFNRTGLIDVVIPSSTLTIGKYAFAGIASMHTLVIGSETDKTERLYKSQLTTITDLAFQGCSALKVVELPMNLKKIGTDAFENCTMLDKLYVYSRNAVFGDRVVPKSTTIYGATGSTAEAYANANGNPFVAIDSEIAAVEQAYEDYLVAIEAVAQLKANTEDTDAEYFFYKKTNDATGGVAGLIPSNPNAGKFVLPLIGSYTSDVTGQTFTDFKVTYVKANAFKECEYKSSIYNVVIPEGYTEIQDSAFAGCTELRYITLPDTLNYIRKYAFTNNTWLKSIEFPKNLGEIQQGAFQGSGRLADVTFADGAACYSIGESAFQGTAIETIKLPVLLRTIGTKAFADTPLTDVYIYNRDAEIGEDAFPADTVIHGVAGSTAQAYATENGYTFVADVTDTWDTVINKIDPAGKFAFSVDAQGKYNAATYSAGGKIVVPYEIDFKAADGTVTKGALVTKVGINMFKNVYYRFQVTALVLPEGATVIEDSSFIGCANLVSLTIPSTIQRIEQYSFSSADIHGELVFGINCNFIGQSAFANNNNLEAVYIYNPNCVIEDDAFVYSTNTAINEKVTKEQRVKIYGVKGSTAETYASKNDHEFIEIQAGKFPTISAVKDNKNYILTGDAATNTVVGYARKDASKAYSEKVVFPAKLNGADMTTIQGSLFKLKPYTSSLVAVVIEEGYTTIGDSAFSGCERLVRVQLPSTLTEINNSAFANTALAGELVIPESVTKIGGSAFAGCTNLTSVTITNPTVTIGPNAFSEMTKGFTIRGLTGSTAEEYYTKYKKYGIKFEAIGEYIDPNAPTGEEEPGDKEPGSTQQNKGDENVNKITLFGVQVDDLTLIIIIGIGALMLLLLIAGVVIVIIVVNSDDDDDDDEDDEDDDDEDDEDDDEYDDEDE